MDNSENKNFIETKKTKNDTLFKKMFTFATYNPLYGIKHLINKSNKEEKTMNTYIILIACLSLLGFVFYATMCRFKVKRLSSEANKEEIRLKHQLINLTDLKNIDAYIMIIDENFIITNTNYYIKTNTEAPESNVRVGELIRCKNGIDAGACGGHENCSFCLIRNHIKEAFQSQKEFKDIETAMTFYQTGPSIEAIDVFVSVSGAPIKLQEKQYILLTVKDITNLKKKQEELRQAKREAESATRIKSAFIANLNHEIRTPLNIISGFANLLGNTGDTNERHEYIQLINENTEKLTNLIDDILELSELESNNIDATYNETDLNQVLHKIFGTYNTDTLQNKQLTLSLDLPYPVCYIHAVDKWLTQVFEKTVPLMIRYTKEKNQMTIGYKVRENDIYCYLFSTDANMVPLGSEAYIFEWFHKSFTDNQNTGILLAISRKIIGLMGGEIALFTEKDKGTTLWFTLPVQPIKEPKGANDLFA